MSAIPAMVGSVILTRSEATSIDTERVQVMFMWVGLLFSLYITIEIAIFSIKAIVHIVKYILRIRKERKKNDTQIHKQ